MTFAPRLIRRSLILLAALFLALFFAPTAEASISSGYIYVCNSTASQGPITAIQSDGTHVTIIGGRCSTIKNFGGAARIDPDPELGPDVGSTWWGFIGHGYDYCDPGEGLINPPDGDPYAGGGANLRYNTDASGC